MAEIRLENIGNHFLKGVTLDIADREFLVIVGPSGAGKTTLLHILAGLIPYRGRVFFQGEPVDHLPAHRRRTGLVFQDLMLFPHLTVQKNILLAMKHLKLGPSQERMKTAEILDLFHLKNLASRFPDELSGGEKQRAALARAVASEPKILLLDEPFSSLDYRTARYLRQELGRLQKRLGLTTLFVTHNLDEAKELADRIAVLTEGRLEQVGAPEDIWYSTTGDGGFLETPNLLECTRPRVLGNGLIEMNWAGMTILVPDEGRPVNQVAIPIQNVYISIDPPPGPPINRFTGRVMEIQKSESAAILSVNMNGETIRAEMTLEQLDALHLAPGAEVHGILPLRALRGCR